ncbi:MAG: Fic family protein [Treponema sp.]|nr:Fic family protein [Treponema sp.]
MSELLKVLSEYDSLGIKEQLDYDKFYLYSIITHSTAIEGSTVTEIENQLLFDEGISPSKTLAEQFMNLDLKAAYEKAFELADKHTQITTELLCSLSAILMKNTGSEYNTIAGSFSSAKGELRLLNVSAGRGGKSYMAWQKVESKLADFCSWLNEKRNTISKNDIEAVYALSFEAHYRLVYIHPWSDGNGRMSRLLMNMIQKEFGVLPSVVKKEKRAEYIKSLAESQENDNSQLFLDFMLNHHIDNILEQISEYKNSMSDDTLKVQNDTLNDTLKLSDKECVVFELIKSDLNINTDQIVEKTGFGRATVMRAIKVLKEKGLVDRNGSKKTGSWELVKVEN